MKKYFLFILIPFIANCEESNKKQSEYSKKVGHFFWNMSSPSSNYEEPLDVDEVAKGFKEASQDKPSPMTDEEFFEYSKKIEKANFEKTAANNLFKSEQYLKEISKDAKPIIFDKLYYKTIIPGSEELELGNDVILNLKATFLDGSILSHKISTPISLPLCIRALREGLKGIKHGETRLIYSHPDLAYGKMLYAHPNEIVIIEISIPPKP